jgi:3-oxoadipate enol-lactonase
MSLIEINKIKLNVQIKGNGNPIILIHGVGGDISQWVYEIERLSKSYKTIAFDCRGHGKSDKPTNYTLQDHISDAIGIMDYLQIKEISVYGVSMGSYIGQGLAIKLGERIDKLILISPKSNGLTTSMQKIIKENPEEFEGVNQHEMFLALLKYISYNPKTLRKYIDLLETKLMPEQFLLANKALSNFDFRNELSKVKAKTLVISGKYDRLNPPSEGEICAKLIPCSKFIEMKYSGHAPMFEEPDEYSKIIDGFLSN